jgi:hypothetical protein
MKYLLMLLLSTTVNAKTIKEGDMEYQCQPKKTCDEQLKAARAEIKRLKQLLLHKEVVEYPYPVEKIVTKTTIKKHIVSLVAIDSIQKVEVAAAGSTAHASAESGLVPGITYQYQTDMGLVGLIGASFGASVKPILGLGIEF